ncbi:hypothetical protein [Burkholderia territorii]|uniref:hypothetical protein n=1 Tax=Burkholderia territorii TaxID=1503055 RepID=UPI0009C19EF2|nr:hypothetical protein [Burkholderia territorii]
MKPTHDRLTLASFRHPRSSQRNRSACLGTSSASVHANVRSPKRCRYSGMEQVRVVFAHLACTIQMMLDDADDDA